MLQILPAKIPGYFPDAAKLKPIGFSSLVRRSREFARTAAWTARTTQPSREYRPGKLYKGHRVTFALHPGPDPIKGGAPRLQAVSAASAASCLGLSSIPIWKSPQGLNGLTPRMARDLVQEVWAMEPLRKRLAVPLVTLPTFVLLLLDAVPGGWERFRKRYLQEWTRALVRAGLDPLWTGVVEMQPGRSKDEGKPCPHIHLLVENRRVGKDGKLGRWIVKPKHHDAMIKAAIKTATGEDVPLRLLRAAGSLRPLKSSVVEYFGKYASKGVEAAGAWNTDPTRGLYVKSWRFSSRACKARAAAHTPVLHGEFARFCRDFAGVLERAGYLKAEVVEAKDGMPELLWVKAIRRDGIELAWHQWKYWEQERVDRGEKPRLIYKPLAEWPESPEMRFISPGLVVIDRPRDELGVGATLIPGSYSEPDVSNVPVSDRISSPLGDILKERLELVYRKIEIAEPVFPAPLVLREEGQLEIPLDLGLTGSAWDVAVTGGGDPYWDLPGWKGGPPG